MFTLYQITNSLNGKSYIGITIQKLSKRFSQHKWAVSRGSEYHIHRAMRRDGLENFQLTILEQGQDYEYAIKILEPKYIAELKPEYNMTKGGEGTIGWIPSKEFRENQRIRMLGNTRSHHDEKTRKIIGDAKRGKKYGPQSPEHLQKRIAAATGKKRGQIKKRTPEQSLAQSLRQTGKPHPQRKKH